MSFVKGSKRAVAPLHALRGPRNLSEQLHCLTEVSLRISHPHEMPDLAGDRLWWRQGLHSKLMQVEVNVAQTQRPGQESGLAECLLLQVGNGGVRHVEHRGLEGGRCKRLVDFCQPLPNRKWQGFQIVHLILQIGL